MLGIGHGGLEQGGNADIRLSRGVERDLHPAVIPSTLEVEALPGHDQRIETGTNWPFEYARDVGRILGR